MDKNIKHYFIYQICYWAIWLLFVYGVVRFSDSLRPLWLLAIPILMSITFTNED